MQGDIIEIKQFVIATSEDARDLVLAWVFHLFTAAGYATTAFHDFQKHTTVTTIIVFLPRIFVKNFDFARISGLYPDFRALHR